MIRLLVAAPASGSGKTTVVCALLEAFKRRGLSPCAFKCGPDYIDPMFHRAVLGVDSRNLDLFLASEEAVRAIFDAGICGHGAAVCEGAMGLYDGVGGDTDRASAWHVAHTLDLPVLLVVKPKGSSLTLAAQLKGLRDFRKNSHIAGILLNDCREGLANMLAPMLERETGIPVLGCLPHLEGASVESRHLGLYTAGEIKDLTDRIGRAADSLEAHADMEKLCQLCKCNAETPVRKKRGLTPKRVRIAVASDEAFCFTYAETLAALEQAGAELVEFSPLRDQNLPEHIGGLYLPGGYPELYAGQLAENRAMRCAVRQAVAAGLPTVAECGGFLYLGQSLRDERGQVWPMAGVLLGEGFPTDKLVRFGYAQLTAREDSLLFRTGETVPVHEFHYWDSTDNGAAFASRKGSRSWDCGFASETMYAAFPHLYPAGRPELVRRFVDRAERFAKEHG